MFNVNEYFDGKVKSLSYKGEKLNATIGVMAAGEYEFGTSTVEYMTVTSGKMLAMMPGETEWKTYNEFETFIVPANVKFKVKVEADTSYRCLYE
jgi:purine/pyrimidine-nucleoside phosphorylase